MMKRELIPTEARLASRVILIDERNRVLFCHGEDRARGVTFWVMPGGGLDPGESFEEAARRETFEETGLTVEIGACVWHRRHQMKEQGWDQYERYFVARVPYPSEVAGEKMDSYITGYRWWTLEEIEASDETFAPRRIAELLPPVLLGECGGDAFDCGV